ncbi:MAG: hypothetical protein ACOYB4_11660, partial [Methyloceanibacter sp.]
TRTWKAVDDCGNETVKSQTITVQDVTDPELTVPADVTVECSAVPEVGSASATDNCDSDPAVTYEGEVRTDGTCADGYVLTRTWKAVDDCGNETVKSQVITVEDTTKPVLSGQGADDMIECPATPEFTAPTAADNCDSTPKITFEDLRTPGECPAEYRVTRTWSVEDACGNIGEPVSQTITIVDTQSPVLEGVPADATNECSAISAPAEVTATDNCAGKVPVQFAETTNGTCPTILTRVWTAADDCGNAAAATQTVTVVDTAAPAFNEPLPEDVAVECDAVPAAATLTASDRCDAEVPVVFAETRVGQAHRMSRVAAACPDSYVLVRTWTATDDCGNSVAHTQTVTVADTRAPVLEGVPADATNECSAISAPAEVTATDNCAG